MNIEIVPSDRIDHCSACGSEHGYNCPKDNKMTNDQENHLRDLKFDFLKLVDAKYRAGQVEHGGDLWKKPGVLEMAMEEVIDMYVYLHVLKQQRDNPEIINKELKDK